MKKILISFCAILLLFTLSNLSAEKVQAGMIKQSTEQSNPAHKQPIIIYVKNGEVTSIVSFGEKKSADTTFAKLIERYYNNGWQIVSHQLSATTVHTMFEVYILERQ